MSAINRRLLTAAQILERKVDKLQAHLDAAPEPPSMDMSSDEVVEFLNKWAEWKDNETK
jgi:hypothetical protein